MERPNEPIGRTEEVAEDLIGFGRGRETAFHACGPTRTASGGIGQHRIASRGSYGIARNHDRVVRMRGTDTASSKCISGVQLDTRQPPDMTRSSETSQRISHNAEPTFFQAGFDLGCFEQSDYVVHGNQPLCLPISRTLSILSAIYLATPIPTPAARVAFQNVLRSA